MRRHLREHARNSQGVVKRCDSDFDAVAAATRAR